MFLNFFCNLNLLRSTGKKVEENNLLKHFKNSISLLKHKHLALIPPPWTDSYIHPCSAIFISVTIWLKLGYIEIFLFRKFHFSRNLKPLQQD